MSDEQSELSDLKRRLNTLTSLSQQLEKVRSSPAVLLERGLPPDNSLLGLTANLFRAAPSKTKDPANITTAFQNLGELFNQLQEQDVEDALQSVMNLPEGLHVAATDFQEWLAERRELRKTQTVDSSLITFEEPIPSRPIFVPPLRPNANPLSSSQLLHFIKDFNRARSNRKMAVRICCSDRNPGTLKDPITIRMILEDVLIAYVTLGFDDASRTQDSPLSVEFVSVFGCREIKPIHTSSEFAVFRQLTQYLTGIIRDHPDISFQSTLRILESYRDIFFARCISCDRVASAAGNLPPIARLWTKLETAAPAYEANIDGVQHGDLTPWHLDCLET